MHSQESGSYKNQEENSNQLPSISQPPNLIHKRKSSLRSLQEIQSRRSQLNSSQHSRQVNNEQLSNAVLPQNQIANLLNMSYDPVDKRVIIDRSKGKSYLEGSMSMFHTKQPGQSEDQSDQQDIQDEKSQIINTGRKRSPSDIIRRKSQPVTPKRAQATVSHHFQEQLPTSAGLKQSFKLQTLAPLGIIIQSLNFLHQDGGILPELSQTHRIGQPTGQIGPFFSNNPSQTNVALRPSVNGSQSGRASRQKGRSNSFLNVQENIPKWGSRASTFQFKNSPPKEVSEFLQQVIQEPIGLMYQKPNDIDSTEPLDSFLDTLYLMVNEKVLDFNEAFQQKLHLAAGIRQNVCEDIMNYFAQLQTRNKLLINAVEFFNEYLTKISQLEGDKMEREKQINFLISEKEDLFLSKYDLERKLAEMTQALNQAQSNEKEAVQHLKNLQKKFDAKVAECESLVFRLRHVEDMDNMLEPPGITNQSFKAAAAHENINTDLQEKNATIESLPDENQRMAKHSSTGNSQSIQNDALRNIEAANKKLETELVVTKEALAKLQESQFKDNVDHFVRIQELFNKVQIENKQLKTTNKKLESKLEAKERLVTHLESKVTQVMIDKEEVIVQLKSEIVLLNDQLASNDRNFESRLDLENKKFQKEYMASFAALEKKLKDEKDQVLMEKSDLTGKLNQNSKELEQMASDYSQYRSEITKKDQEKEKSIDELQSKLKQSGQLNESQTKLLQDRIETLSNQNQVQTKQNAILELKLRLIRDQVETLFKQKCFIVDNIERSRINLAKESAQVEESMMNQNDSKEYLISVKKAVKMSQAMVELGLEAIAKVSQIVAFLKIDEVRNMIAAQDSESLAKAQDIFALSSSDNQQQDIEKLNLLFQQEDIQDGSEKQGRGRESNIANFKINQKLISQPSGIHSSVHSAKSEEHYFNKNPMELCSIVLKVFGEVFITTGTIDDELQLPSEYIRLVSNNSKRTDQQVEQEIYSNFLSNTKRMLEDRFYNLYEENRQLKAQIDKIHTNIKVVNTVSNDEKSAGDPSGLKSRLKNVSKDSSNITGTNPATGTIGEAQQLQDGTNAGGVTALPRRGNSAIIRDESSLGLKKESSYNANNPASIESDSQKNRRVSSIGSRQASAKHRTAVNLNLGIKPTFANQNAYEQEIESMRLQLEDYKSRSKDIQVSLASKIVLLEEQIEDKRLKQEQELSELEQLQRDEIDRTKQGISQREAQLKQRADEYREKAEHAEEQIRRIREQVSFLNSEIQRITNFYKESDHIIQQKDQEIKVYKENVQSYVNLKVNKRNLFSITIEINQMNQTMINEAMIKYYLHKCLKLDKNKFRFISTEEQQVQWQLEKFENLNPLQEAQLALTSKKALTQNYMKSDADLSKIVETPNEEVTVVKILIEIVDDQENVDKQLKLLKTQIREGTSILYDLKPLFLSLNLGQSGLQQTSNNATQLRNYHLIKRRGVMIRQTDFVVSVLRHRNDPLSIIIIAASTNLAEEFILELQARDLFEITEGETWKLEASEPTALIDTIIDNLTISVKQPGNVRSLQCEHKIFFNEMFIQNHNPIPNVLETQKMLDNISKMFPNKDCDSHSTQSQDSLAFRNTKFREQQIVQKVSLTGDLSNEEFKKHIRHDVQCQTDPESNLSSTNLLSPALFASETFTNTFQGYQRLGKSLELKIKIDEGQKSGTYILNFEEIRTKQKCQVCMVDPSRGNRENSRYVIHSECLKFIDSDEEPHMMLITFEKFQEDGFLIKLHDLKAPASEEFFIIRKSKGQYSRINRAAGIETLISNGKEHEELRNLLFDLTFTLSVPSQQILYANLAAMEQQLANDPTLMEGNNALSAVTDLIQMPSIKQADRKVKETAKVNSMNIVMLPAVARLQSDQYQLPSGVLLQKHERGELFYRNIFTVRCCFDNNIEKEHESLISFYERKGDGGSISVEVFLYRESQKMSIASQVSSAELFGNDYNGLSYFAKIEMLDQMMEKLYVLSDNSQFHLKVENDAVSMTQLKRDRKKNEELLQENQNNQGNLIHSSQSPSTHRFNDTPHSNETPVQRPPSTLGPTHYTKVEMKLKEIEEAPVVFLASDQATHIKSYAQISSKLMEYNAYYLSKQEHNTNRTEVTQNAANSQGSPAKKAKLSTKKTFNEKANNTSSNVEDSIDFEFVYLNATQKDGKKYSCLLSTKMVMHVMTCNPLEITANFALLQSKDKEKLTDYFKHHSKIDFTAGRLVVESVQPSHEYINKLFANEIGGTYIRREENQARFDLENSLVEKKLLMNQEVDMSEFSYDVKLYQVFGKNKEEQKVALSYSFELFCLNEPDLVYRYNHALHEQSSHVHSPVHIGFDMVNLIENPLSKVRINEDSKRKAEFQQLFSKYIDNKFIFAVNEQIFPHQINFCIYEPSSRLHWSHTFDPQLCNDEEYQQTLSKSLVTGGRWNIEIGQLSILDQGTSERFIALMMADVLNHCAPSEIVSQDMREDTWADVGDQESLRYEILKDKHVSPDIVLNISKLGTDCINIELFNPKQFIESESTQNDGIMGLLHKVKQVQKQKEEHLVHMMKFSINATQRNKYISKLIRVKDHEMNRVQVLTCDLRDPQEIVVKVVEMVSPTVLQTEETLRKMKAKILYQYTFREKKHANYGLGIALDLQKRHLQEAVAEVVTSGIAGSMSAQTVDRAASLYEVITKQQQKKPEMSIFTEGISLTQRRLIANAGVQSGIRGDKQTLVLHRKTFYDEPHEKLIIVSVQIECTLNRRKGHGPAQMCLQDITSFRLNISEPETQRKKEFDYRISDCFLEEEIQGGINLKNVSHLKKMAKVLVEERAIIKRVNTAGREEDHHLQNSNLYTVEINISQITQPLNINEETANSVQTQQQNFYTASSKGEQELAEIHSLMKTKEAKSRSSEDMQAAVPNDIKITSGQTNIPQNNQQPNNSITKSASQPQREVMPPQQSVIEEEGSQEEMDDSPNVVSGDYSNGELIDKRGVGQRYQDPMDAGEDEDDMEREEEPNIDEDEESIGEDEMIIDDEEPIDQEDDDMLLYERQISKNTILQIVRSTNSKFEYQIRQKRVDSNQAEIITELNNSSVEQIAQKSKVSKDSLEEEQPELFEALAEYVLQRFIGTK